MKVTTKNIVQLVQSFFNHFSSFFLLFSPSKTPGGRRDSNHYHQRNKRSAPDHTAREWYSPLSPGPVLSYRAGGQLHVAEGVHHGNSVVGELDHWKTSMADRTVRGGAEGGRS